MGGRAAVSVVVVGGGYAGVNAVRKLSRLSSRWKLTLIDRRNVHELTTRLPEVLAGSIEPDLARLPYSSLFSRNVRVIQAEVLSIDPVARRVFTSQGRLQADFLIVTVGVLPGLHRVEGASTYGTVFKSIADAEGLRHRLLTLTAASAMAPQVAIVGSGYTGTEVAGELVSWEGWSRHNADLTIRTTIVDEEDRLMPRGNIRIAAVAENVLRKKGVELKFGTPVARVEEGRVLLAEGGEVESDVVIWATRSEGALGRSSGEWPDSADGRIPADSYLAATGYQRVYVAGDIASAPDIIHGGTAISNAQVAVQAGATAARNVWAEATGRSSREFRVRTLGEALTLGNGDAVAEVLGVVVTGKSALATKRAALARYLTGLGGTRLARLYL